MRQFNPRVYKKVCEILCGASLDEVSEIFHQFAQNFLTFIFVVGLVTKKAGNKTILGKPEKGLLLQC